MLTKIFSLRKPVISLSFFWIAAVISIVSTSAIADDLTDRIKVGDTRDSVTSVFGSAPTSTNCQTTIGVTSCKLTWNIGSGVFTPTKIYEITTLADRVVNVSWQIKRPLIGMPWSTT